MPAPTTSWNLVRVYGTWRGQNGALKAGSYKVTIPARVTNHTNDVIIPAGVFAQGELQTANDAAPSLDLLVPATDDPDNDQTGWQAILEVNFGDAANERYSLDVPVAARPVEDGGTGVGVNLSAVALPTTIPQSNPVYKVGVAGGLARLDESGNVIDADGNVITGGEGTLLTSYSTQIADLPDYPEEFPPITHEHLVNQINGLDAELAALPAFTETMIRFSSLAGEDDDAKLATAITAVQSTTLKGRTILLDENRDYTFHDQVVIPSGFSLQGTFRPQDQARSSRPVGNRILLRMEGASSGQGWLKITSGNTFGVALSNLSIDGDANSSVIDGSEDNGGVLWTSVFRDISAQNCKSFAGSSSNRLQVTADSISGFWNLNNIRETAWNIGGSDFVANPEMMLIDSPPELLGFDQYLMQWNFMSNAHVKHVYMTAEGHAGVLIDGSNSTSQAFWLEDWPAIEGRNEDQPSPGALVRMEAGQAMIRGTRFAFGMANPDLITSRADKGVIHIAGGNAVVQDCTYERGNTVIDWEPEIDPEPTLGPAVAEDVPFIYVASGAKVRVRNIIGNGPVTGERSWSGKPVVKQAVAGLADCDDSVELITAMIANVPNEAGDTATGASNTGTSITLNKPTNTADGDLLVAAVYTRAGGAPYTTPPAGWTVIDPVPDITAAGIVRLYWKRVTSASGEPINFTWAGGGSGRHVGVITRVLGTTASPVDLAGAAATEISSPERIILPGVTTTAESDLLIMVATSNGTGGTSPTFTPAEGEVIASVQTSTGVSESSMTLAFQEAVPQGATGSRVMTASAVGSTGVGYLAAIKSEG